MPDGRQYSPCYNYHYYLQQREILLIKSWGVGGSGGAAGGNLSNSTSFVYNNAANADL